MCALCGKKGAHGYLVIRDAESSRGISGDQKFVSGVLAKKKAFQPGLCFPAPFASKWDHVNTSGQWNVNRNDMHPF